MDIFLALSKIFWALAAPSTALIGLVAVSALASALIPAVRALARAVLLVAALSLAFAAYSPLPFWLIRPLEERFPPAAEGQEPPAGIILLGGAMRAMAYGESFRVGMSDAADRIREAARLARKYPDAPVIVSGGLIAPRPAEPTDAEMMAEMLVEWGVRRDRIILEDASRSTTENAHLSAQRVERDGEWVLVTSAYHMPRAIGAFRQAGWTLRAAPTDWRQDTDGGGVMTAAQRLETADIAVKEWLGLLAYWIAGRSSALFPGPDTAS
jgi:uncharacterized SAM-binding protein YcdF (DUF218 family)